MTHAVSQDAQTDSLSKLQARVKQNPNDGAAWLAIAQILAHTKSGPDLSMAIRRSIELLPEDYQAWLLAGLEMQQSRGTSTALQWLHHISQQRPGLAAPRLARAQLEIADLAATAAQSFQSIIEDFPADARPHLLYAELLQNQGQLHAAGDQLEMALNIKPEIARNWAALAMIRLAEGRYDAVVSAATKALNIDILAKEARMSRAQAYQQAAQWQPAMEDYRELLKLMPDNPYILVGLGACLAGSGDFDAALLALNRALQIKPDFIEATLNIGLVLASQGKNSVALDHFTKLLAQSRLPDALRDQALVTQTILLEQQRLPALLAKVAENHNLQELQNALQSAPEILLQTDPQTETVLRDMALASQQFTLQVPDIMHGLERHHAAFVEACLLSRTANNAAEMAKLWQAQQQHETEGRMLCSAEQNLRTVWKLVLDRQRLCALQTNQGYGEALLRYWHFRMFEKTAGYLPGLFKFAPNNIGLHQTTAPQQVIRSVQYLLDEIYSSLPAGLSRAALILTAIGRIHAFVDGNGRMARFLFGWELECAHLPPIQWTPDLRINLIHCLNEAKYENNFGAFQEGLQQAAKSTETLFRDFSERLAQI